MADVTVIGNLTADPELRWTNNGKAVANLTIAVSERRFNRQKNEWEDGDTWFARCTIWGEPAEHAAQSLVKGIRVIGHGKVKQRQYEDQQGNKRSSVEVELYDLGASLKYETTQFTKAQPRGNAGGGYNASSQPGAGDWPSAPSAGAVGDSGWAQPNEQFDTEAPF